MKVVEFKELVKHYCDELDAEHRAVLDTDIPEQDFEKGKLYGRAQMLARTVKILNSILLNIPGELQK